MQLENTIRLLLELEPDSDPVWHYLTIQVSSLSTVPLSKTFLNHNDYGNGYIILGKLTLDDINKVVSMHIFFTQCISFTFWLSFMSYFYRTGEFEDSWKDVL